MATNPAKSSTRIDAEKELARRTRRAFLIAGAGVAAGVGSWAWLTSGAGEGSEGPAILRRTLNFNEKVIRSALYSNQHLAPEFPDSSILPIRANGDIGLGDELDAASPDWRIQVTPWQSAAAVKVSMDEVRALPRRQQTIEFKCVEGWSAITKFAGARLSDFIAKFAPGSESAPFVSMTTPDGEYYVSLDMPSALHPQTLLAWEMNGEELNDDHGAPLRLVTPVKYGIKNIKRIATVGFAAERPRDYWAERGYDWYAGL